MVNDPGKPLLRLEAGKPQARLTRDSPGFPQALEKFQRQAQGQRHGPKFQRLADVLARDPAGLEIDRLVAIGAFRPDRRGDQETGGEDEQRQGIPGSVFHCGFL